MEQTSLYFEPYLGDSHAVPEWDVFPVDFRYVDGDNLNLQKDFENDLGWNQPQKGSVFLLKLKKVRIWKNKIN